MNGNFAELVLKDGTIIDEFNAKEYSIKLVLKKGGHYENNTIKNR